MCYVICGSFKEVSTRNLHRVQKTCTKHCFGFVICFLLLTDVVKALGHNRIALYRALSAVLVGSYPVQCMKML